MNRVLYFVVGLTVTGCSLKPVQGGDTLASLLIEPFKALDTDNKETDRAVHRLINTVFSSIRATKELNETVQGMLGVSDQAEVEGVRNDLNQLNESLAQLKALLETDDCASSPCVHGQCRDFLTGYNCHCYSGYTGKNCSDVDDCPANGCHGNGECVDLDGGYECRCFHGYGGRNCDTKDFGGVFSDCQEALDKVAGAQSGVYTIRVATDGGLLTTRVFCDMDTDGGGWTVFQKRFDGQQDFYRSHQEYADGFGDPAGEYWLGLNRLHSMTSQKAYQLRVDLTAADNSTAYQLYRTFSIGPGSSYQLTVGDTSGSAGDGLSHDNGNAFLTKDNSTNGCVTSYKTSWWGGCGNAYLNSDYITPGIEPTQYLHAVIWYSWKQSQSLKATSMKIKPLS